MFFFNCYYSFSSHLWFSVAVRYKFTPCTGPPIDERCKFCDHHHTIGGPIWLDSIHDKSFISLVKNRLDEIESGNMKLKTLKRIVGLIEVINEELIDVPLFYSCDQICRIINCTPPKSELLRSALLNSGYQVSSSHAHRSSFKTNAPNQFIWDIFKSWALTFTVGGETIKTTDKMNDKSVTKKIVSSPILSTISFTLHPDAKPPSREKGLLRYQPNPLPFWGPKCRPGENNLEDDKRIKNQGKKKKKLEDNVTLTMENEQQQQQLTEPPTTQLT